MKKNLYYNISLSAILVIAVVMYVLLMFNNNVWYDEAYSLAMIKHSFSEIARITAEDVHPPLYYFGLKVFCMIFGNNLISAKIFSIIPIVLTAILGYFGLSDLFDKKTGLAFAAAMVLLPLYQGYSVEIRMYTWASFTVFGCGLYAFRAIWEDNKLHWLWYTIFGILSAYLHYFAFVSVLVICFLTLLGAVYKSKVTSWLGSTVVFALSYIPWMSSFAAQLSDKVNNDYWIAPITTQTVKDFFKVWLQCGDITLIYIWLFAALLVGCLAAIIIKHDSKKIWAASLGMLIFIATCVIGIIASVVIRPVFIERYAVPAIPLVLVLVAVGISSIKFKSIIATVAALGVVTFGISYVSVYSREYNASEKHIEAMLAEREYDAIVCCVDSHLYGVLAHYSPQKPVYRPRTSLGSPFDNILPLSERKTDKEKTVLLFVPQKATPDPQTYEGYNITYTCDVATYGMVSNVYTCTKQN